MVRDRHAKGFDGAGGDDEVEFFGRQLDAATGLDFSREPAIKLNKLTHVIGTRRAASLGSG
jgi:hypothetical protein